MGMKVCPHCGSTMFAARIVIPGVVRSSEDGSFNIFKESKDKQDIEIAMCARCRSDLTGDELVEGVACKECGRVVSPSDIDENGICDVCNAKKQRADLANASQEDLIKMIINMEKASKGLIIPTPATPEPVSTEAVQAEEAISEEVQEENSEEANDTGKKSGRKRRAKRETAEAEPQDTNDVAEEEATAGETSEATTESTTDITSDVNELANQQEAPFPEAIAEDITGVTNNDETPAPTTEGDVSGVSNFAMYESDEAF